jgi:hypothetical protein
VRERERRRGAKRAARKGRRSKYRVLCDELQRL